ncbi:LOW QUALITY PROTEIN: hypothetical protein ACHAXN_006279 [Cyclotella atomus]
MLRPSNLRPAISAYAYVFGTHDYIRVPLAPLGCKTQCFVGPDNQTSYGEDSVDLWYIGTSTKRYRSSKVLVKETGAERMTDTLFTEAIKGNLDKEISKLGMKELERLADIFEKAAERDAASPRVATQSTEVPRVPKKESAQTDSPPPLHRVSDKEDGENEDAPTGMVDTEEPAPRFNLRSAARGNIMTDVMLSVIEMSGKDLTPKQLSGRQFPMQFLYFRSRHG